MIDFILAEGQSNPPTISIDNPYVDIKYSEYIQIDKR